MLCENELPENMYLTERRTRSLLNSVQLASAITGLVDADHCGMRDGIRFIDIIEELHSVPIDIQLGDYVHVTAKANSFTVPVPYAIARCDWIGAARDPFGVRAHDYHDD